MEFLDSLFLHRKYTIYHGWWIVLVVFLGGIVGFGIGSIGLGVFIPFMSEDLGWSRTAISGVFTVRAIMMAVSGPIVGFAVDKKWGPRVLMVGGGIVSGVSLLILSQSNHVWQFYLSFGVLWSIGQTSFSGPVLSGALVSKWFVRLRGRAFGFYTMGIPAGGAIFVPLIAILISWQGWRGAWITLAIMTWLIIIPLSLLIVRRQPEDMGLLPDGSQSPEEGLDSTNSHTGAKASVIAPHETTWTVTQALHTSTVWLLLIGFVLSNMAGGAFMVHQVAAISDKGYNVELASGVMAVLFFFSFFIKPIAGFMAERLPVRYVAGFFIALAGASLFVLAAANTVPHLMLFAVLYGCGVGATTVLQSIIWADYFGRQFQGAIRGTLSPLFAISQAFSPLFAGWMYDTTGSYDQAFTVVGIAAFCASILILLARPPVLRPISEKFT
jgi:MFS family permease